MAQIAIEVIGVVIGLLNLQQKVRTITKGGEDSKDGPQSPASSRYDKLNSMSTEVDTELGELTPEINARVQF